MPAWNVLIDRFRPKTYGRRESLVLINGLAEQAESWFKNRRYWSRYFDVHMPNFLVYDGAPLHARIEQKIPITVDYLVEQLHTYLYNFAQSGPYHLVASSLGGKIAVEFAVKYPEMVRRIVLLCPSGMGDKEQLPIMEGVKSSDWNSVVKSVFFRTRHVDRDIVKYYKSAVLNRRWKTGVLRTVRGTTEHSIREQLKNLNAPTLVITGLRDRVCDPKMAEEAAKELPNGHFLPIPRCGHAPQIERYRLINRRVVHFLTAEKPSAHPRWTQQIIVKPTRAKK